MIGRPVFHTLIILTAVLGALLAASGCGEKPGVSADQFVGTWRLHGHEDAAIPPGPPFIVLRGDARGTMADPPNPHPMEVIWVVSGETLRLTPRGGGSLVKYSYHFNSPDELLLTIGELELTYRREQPQEDSAADTPSSASP